MTANFSSSLPAFRSLRDGLSRRLRAQRSTHVVPRWIFLRLMGLVYLCAFASLLTQVDGLIGSEGVMPAKNLLEAIRQQTGGAQVWEYPTLCWMNPSDGFLHAQCWAGIACALLLIAGVLPPVAAAGAWVLCLSLCVAGQVFLQFQWDSLLLEAGFLTVLLAPWQVLPRFTRERPPSRIAVWLFRWLVFRLMFLSGAVKLLATANAAWWDGTALPIHYQTQPLPTWIAWHVYHWPGAFHQLSTLLMFGIELILPSLVFGFRASRWVAFAGFTGLMGIIALTGNYTFFNLLTAALCVMLLDDRLLQRWLPARFRSCRFNPVAAPEASSAKVAAPPPWRARLRTVGRVLPHLRTAGLSLIAAGIVWVTGTLFFNRLLQPASLPPALLKPLQWTWQFRSFNAYGLFASMTLTRPEIVIEGSEDGRVWRDYEFRWKPGDPGRAPGFVAPHQPRLDWQMWFAALGNFRSNPWLANLMVRLLQGEPTVLELMGENPFPNGPPRYIRSVLYNYEFTSPEERAATGNWWKRQPLGLYSPPFELPPELRRPPKSP